MAVTRAEAADALVVEAHVPVDTGVLVVPAHQEDARWVLALECEESADGLERELPSVHPVA